MLGKDVGHLSTLVLRSCGMTSGLFPYGRSRVRTSRNGKLAASSKIDIAGTSYRKRLPLPPYLRVLKAGYSRSDECLIFKGFIKPDSYGQVAVRRPGKSYDSAHRVVFETWYGPVPEGMVIDHACHNEALSRGECTRGRCKHRACINPAHLRAITFIANIAASISAQAEFRRQSGGGSGGN